MRYKRKKEKEKIKNYKLCTREEESTNEVEQKWQTIKTAILNAIVENCGKGIM